MTHKSCQLRKLVGEAEEKRIFLHVLLFSILRKKRKKGGRKETRKKGNVEGIYDLYLGNVCELVKFNLGRLFMRVCSTVWQWRNITISPYVHTRIRYSFVANEKLSLYTAVQICRRSLLCEYRFCEF